MGGRSGALGGSPANCTLGLFIDMKSICCYGAGHGDLAQEFFRATVICLVEALWGLARAWQQLGLCKADSFLRTSPFPCAQVWSSSLGLGSGWKAENQGQNTGSFLSASELAW